MGFNLSDYEPVEDRISRFYADHPEGRIVTELVSSDDKRCEFKASLFLDASDVVKATGYAQETAGSSPVNKTNHYENCETSAIGRALANAGYAPKGARPSREEMSKAASRAQAPGKSDDKVVAKLKLLIPEDKDGSLRKALWASFQSKFNGTAEAVLLGCDDLAQAQGAVA